MIAAVIPSDPVRALLDSYPRIFFACHTRHVRDPESGELVSATQANILDHLDDVQTIGVLDLARHMGVTPATISITVDRLVRRGYVERTRDTEDARRVRLRLTAEGLRVREARSVLDPDLVKAMLAMLTPEEVERGLEGLALLARGAQALMHARSEQGKWAGRSRKREEDPGTQEKHRTR